MTRSKNTFLPRKQKRRLNAPPTKEPWVWMTRELLASDAFRLLSPPAFLVLFRIIIEHMNHAGLENGRLKVTYLDFEAYGCRYKSIKNAIEEVVATGLVDVPYRGRRSHGQDHGAPAEYRLTWLPAGSETDFQPPTNRWKGKRGEDFFSRGENAPVSRGENAPRQPKNGQFSRGENAPTYKILSEGAHGHGNGADPTELRQKHTEISETGLGGKILAFRKAQNGERTEGQ